MITKLSALLFFALPAYVAGEISFCHDLKCRELYVRARSIFENPPPFALSAAQQTPTLGIGQGVPNTQKLSLWTKREQKAYSRFWAKKHTQAAQSNTAWAKIGAGVMVGGGALLASGILYPEVFKYFSYGIAGLAGLLAAGILLLMLINLRTSRQALAALGTAGAVSLLGFVYPSVFGWVTSIAAILYGAYLLGVSLLYARHHKNKGQGGDGVKSSFVTTRKRLEKKKTPCVGLATDK